MLFGDEEDDKWVSFPHKIIHEYIAACYLVEEIANSHKMLEELFPKWKSIKRHEEVYNFCIGCSKNASVFIEHFCEVLSETIISNVQNGQIELCHSRMYKMDTVTAKNDEMRGYSDKAELTQVLAAICRESRVHGTACMNPVCNEYMHIYPACSCIDPIQICKSNLVIFTEGIKSSPYLMGATENMNVLRNKGETCLVIFGDEKVDNVPSDRNMDLSMINHAMSYCNITEVYLRDCTFEHSMKGDNSQNVKHLFTKSLKTLYMKNCRLSPVLWAGICKNLEGSKALVSAMLRDCIGVTEYVVTSITDPVTLTKLWLDGCRLSSQMCEVVCKQLIHLRHLEGLDLSGNPIGVNVTHITAAITAWSPEAKLRRLYLTSCELPRELIPSLLSAVRTGCPDMQYLNIGGNHIGGCLPSFMTAAPDLLRYFYVQKCRLQLKDVESITAVLRHGALKHLSFLDMENNSLSDSVVEPLLQAANIHHQGKLEVNLKHNNLSAEFTTRWSSQCRRKLHLYLHPQGEYQELQQRTCTIL